MAISDTTDSLSSILISILKEEIQLQKERMVEVAKRKKEYIQYDDLLQPQDFPEIESDGDFRFEEGVLYGFERILIIARKLSISPEN